MNRFFRALSLYREAIRTSNLRKKILFTLLILILFRFIAHVPVPGVNTVLLKSF